MTFSFSNDLEHDAEASTYITMSINIVNITGDVNRHIVAKS